MAGRGKHSFRSPFSAPKTDINVAWQNVHYAPSPASIRQNLQERFRLYEESRLQRERNLSIYELFGAGKSLTDCFSREKYRMSMSFKTEDTDTDPQDTRDQSLTKSISHKVSRDNPKIKGQRKAASIVDKRVSIMAYKTEISQVAISNLMLLFQQNKPQTFMGIRKPKTFENNADKDMKMELQRHNLTTDTIFALFTKSGSDIPAKKESIKRNSSQLQRMSVKLTPDGVSEIRERLIKSGNMNLKSQALTDVMEILNKAAKDQSIEKERILQLAGCEKLVIPDLEDKLDRERILNLYVNNYYRNSHPMHGQLVTPIVETEAERNIIKHCILNNPALVNVMKKHSLYPHRLRIVLTEIDLKLNKHNEEIDEGGSSFNQKSKGSGKATKSKFYTSKRKVNALDEISEDCKEFNGFYRPLFEHWCDKVIESCPYYGEIQAKNVKYVVQSLAIVISNKRNSPGSRAMLLTQLLIRSGLNNNALLEELCNNVDGWLDQVLKSLLSKYSSIRLESFITICYLVSKPSYIDAINANFFHETLYDLTTSILRCVDLKPDEFPLYYSLLGVLIHYVPSQTILECLMERAPYSSDIEMISKWPRFLYIATRYWPLQNCNSSPIHLRRVIETLENHYLRESLCRKHIKDAITCITKRFSISSNMFTVWPRLVEHFPD